MNAPIMEPISKNWINSLYFQHILDIKQPYVMTEPKKVGCVIKMVDAFFLETPKE